MTIPEKRVVIALGNQFRGDDGAGLFVADQLRKRHIACEIIDNISDALAIMTAWENAAFAVIVDAMITGKPPGTILRIDTDAGPVPKDLARCSSHGMGVAEAIDLSKAMGRLPVHLVIYAIEAKTFEPGIALSPEVLRAAETAAQQIEAEMELG